MKTCRIVTPISDSIRNFCTPESAKPQISLTSDEYISKIDYSTSLSIYGRLPMTSDVFSVKLLVNSPLSILKVHNNNSV